MRTAALIPAAAISPYISRHVGYRYLYNAAPNQVLPHVRFWNHTVREG